jgi:hypothetical protein
VDEESIGRAKSILSGLGYNVKEIQKQVFPFDIVAKKLNEAYLVDAKSTRWKEKKKIMGIQFPSAWPKRAKFIIEELRSRGINCRVLIMVIVADKDEYFCLELPSEIEKSHRWSIHRWSTGTDRGLEETIKDIETFFKE